MPLPFRVLSEVETSHFLLELLADEQRAQFEKTQETDFVYSIEGVARFRANIFVQSQGLGAVFRVIPNKVPTLGELRLPLAVKRLTQLGNGLVLVTGPTGSGKSTTLAAMVDEINKSSQRHVISIEDPIEFLHQPIKGAITQRQVGKHAESFAGALRSALRESPDVLVVGEMRDLETIHLAIAAAETGVLVIGTLHSNSASKALDRIIDVIPEESRDQVRSTLSVLLRGVVSQHLAKHASGEGAVEESARVLGMLRRPRDAAQLLIDSLGVAPAQAGRLDPAGKKRALMAAIFLGRAGDNQQAVQLFLALGEQQRAVELLQKAGDAVGAAKLAALKPGQFETGPMLAPAKATAVGGQAVSMVTAQKLEAQGKLEAALQSYVQLKRFAEGARVAKALGRTADAAQLYADGGVPFDAAQAYLEAGDTGKALENLCRVPDEDPQYRVAAAMAVRVATNLNVLDFRFEHFVGPYVRGGPRNTAGLQVFDLLAALYEANGLPET